MNRINPQSLDLSHYDSNYGTVLCVQYTRKIETLYVITPRRTSWLDVTYRLLVVVKEITFPITRSNLPE